MNTRKLREGFTIGADPEFFLFKLYPSGKSSKFVSAEDLFPGTKDKPHPVANGAVQVDGFAAEININPAKTFEEFDSNLTSVLSQLQSMLPEGVFISEKISVEIPAAIFDKAAPKTSVLGCDPDFNAWTGQLNTAPSIEWRPKQRWVGGHLHFGWTDGEDPDNLIHRAACFDFVKQLDWYLGSFGVIHDRDHLRRTAYGTPGACRVKHYGVEYRTLSSFWVHSTDLRHEVWNRSCAAIDDMRESYAPIKFEKHNGFMRDSIVEGSLTKGMATKYVYPIQTVEA